MVKIAIVAIILFLLPAPAFALQMRQKVEKLLCYFSSELDMFARMFALESTPHPSPLPQGAREVCILSPTRERTEVRGDWLRLKVALR